MSGAKRGPGEEKEKEAKGAAPLAALLVLACLVPTISQELPWYDSAETVVAALRWDIPHQPGYPLYTMIAGAFLRMVPFGSPAARLSLLASLATALAAAVSVRLLLRRGLAGPRGAVVGAVALACAPIVWNSSVVCEVYTFELLLLLSTALALERLRASGRWRDGLGAALFAGACLCHRTSALGLMPAALLLVGPARALEILRGWRVPQRLGAAFCFFLPFSAYAYLWFRLGSPDLVIADPATPRSLATLFAYWSCADYRHALFVYGPLELLVRVKHLAFTLLGQMPVALLLAALAGLRRLDRMDRNMAWACGAVMLVNCAFVANYAAMEADTMLLPTVAALAVLAAVGMEDLFRRTTPRRGLVVAGLVVAWTAGRGNMLLDRDRLHGAEAFAERVHSLIPRGGHLLVSNDVTYRPFLYARFVLGKRPDVAMTVIDGLDGTNAPVLEGQVRRTGVYGPLLHPPGLEPFLRERFVMEPLGPVWHVHAPADRPDGAAEIAVVGGPGGSGIGAALLASEGEIRLGGMRLLAWSAASVDGGLLRRGSLLDLRYSWRCDVPSEAPLAVLLCLVDANGRTWRVHGANVFHDVHRLSPDRRGSRLWRRGEAGRARRVIVVPEDLPLGSWHVWLALCPWQDEGLRSLVLSELAGVNYLNYDGVEQLLRLRTGQRVGEPYWAISSLDDVEGAGVPLESVDGGPGAWTYLGALEIAERNGPSR